MPNVNNEAPIPGAPVDIDLGWLEEDGALNPIAGWQNLGKKKPDIKEPKALKKKQPLLEVNPEAKEHIPYYHPESFEQFKTALEERCLFEYRDKYDETHWVKINYLLQPVDLKGLWTQCGKMGLRIYKKEKCFVGRICRTLRNELERLELVVAPGLGESWEKAKKNKGVVEALTGQWLALAFDPEKVIYE